MEKDRTGKRDGHARWWAMAATANKVVKECFTKNLTFELTFEGGKRTSHVNF